MTDQSTENTNQQIDQKELSVTVQFYDQPKPVHGTLVVSKDNDLSRFGITPETFSDLDTLKDELKSRFVQINLVSGTLDDRPSSGSRLFSTQSIKWIELSAMGDYINSWGSCVFVPNSDEPTTDA